jgi:transposase-like protein
MTRAERSLQRAALEAAKSSAALHIEIREQHSAGMSLRSIAQIVGMSHETVRRIVSPE